MPLTIGTPPADAKGVKRRHKGQFGDQIPELIDLARTQPEMWANLGEWKDEKPAGNFVRSVARGARKDFRPDGAFEAKHEIAEPFTVWVRCINPDAAEEYLLSQENGDSDTDDEDDDDNEDELPAR